MPDSQPARRPAYVACVGDANSPLAWSAIPYHVMAEGVRQGIMLGGLNLDPVSRPWVKRSRLAWSLLHLMKGYKRGGYQYSSVFLDRLWEPERRRIAGARVVSHFQLYPPSIIRDSSVERWYYVDAPLKLLFEHYHDRIDPKWAKKVMETERAGYASAAGVLTMSRFAADSVIRDYGVPADRVHVVLPGANLTQAVFDQFEAEAITWRDPETGRRKNARDDDPTRLVYVGRDVYRKGLDRLLRAMRIARAQGAKLTLRVIGLSNDQIPADLADVEGVEYLGLVSRQTDALRFCRLLAECDIGCLLSRAEMAGISIREFQAMGLATIGTLAGGGGDMLQPGASVGVRSGATDEQVADVLLSVDKDAEVWKARRAVAWRTRKEQLWRPAIEQIGQLFAVVLPEKSIVSHAAR